LNDVLTRLDEWPRSSFIREPTPLLQAPNLASVLGRVPSDVLLKMDAETSFGLGGNKARKLEFELAPDRLNGVTCVITCGGPQSNHSRLTAAAAARLGLRCILVVNGEIPEPRRGNAYLHHLLGAEIHSVDTRAERDPAMAAVAAQVAEEGGKAIVIPLGASTPLGALGYVRAAIEIDEQLKALPPAPCTWVFVSASSCGTYAGLAIGFSLLGRSDVRLVGVSPDVDTEEIEQVTQDLCRGTAELLGTTDALPPNLLIATGEYIGGGYGIPTELSVEATSLLARTEGVLLDPVYTAKTAAGMLDWARKETVPRGDRLVLWHTGGYPAAFV
jgi:1-aminocyclopropane-1-carboxylate deaminase/D-cysteine desulfhydrase-like pyridoxal-dependent ACC family enzyme